jgi:hypothetical protein
MKQSAACAPRELTLCALALASSGCAAIGGIFKAGVWVGVVIVVIVGGVIIWAIKAVLR